MWLERAGKNSQVLLECENEHRMCVGREEGEETPGKAQGGKHGIQRDQWHAQRTKGRLGAPSGGAYQRAMGEELGWKWSWNQKAEGFGRQSKNF